MHGRPRRRRGARRGDLVLWAPDYDGGNKAWVRFADGSDAIVGGSQVRREAELGESPLRLGDGLHHLGGGALGHQRRRLTDHIASTRSGSAPSASGPVSERCSGNGSSSFPASSRSRGCEPRALAPRKKARVIVVASAGPERRRSVPDGSVSGQPRKPVPIWAARRPARAPRETRPSAIAGRHHGHGDRVDDLRDQGEHPDRPVVARTRKLPRWPRPRHPGRSRRPRRAPRAARPRRRWSRWRSRGFPSRQSRRRRARRGARTGSSPRRGGSRAPPRAGRRRTGSGRRRVVPAARRGRARRTAERPARGLALQARPSARSERDRRS